MDEFVKALLSEGKSPLVPEERNPELELAWQFIENTGTHLFLTGKAGTGKTTFLKRLKEKSPKRMIVLAPTGIAAVNAGGVTVHSFFQLPFAPYVPEASFVAGGKAAYRFRFGKEKINIIRSIDLLVIDEISMVRADLLDAVDDVLRRYRADRHRPFGGVQLLMIGDLQQLAPVVKDEEWKMLKNYYDTPYFFSSRALRQTQYCTLELKTVYRQSDNAFLDLLNRIRENRLDTAALDALNRRYLPGFNPPREEGYIRLVTHNAQAQRINDRELEALPGRSYAFRAAIEGKFPDYAYPTDELLELKRGAQIMFVKNDTSGQHRYYNGTIGEVTDISSRSVEVRCKEGGGTSFVLEEEEWTNARYVLDEETREIREEVEGTFRQFPVKLAWAITIHKSQGLTFERAIIDASASFAHGQTYVALSRCKTLEGLVLSAPLSARAVICDDEVERFTEEARQTVPDERQFRSLQQTYFLELLSGLFDFEPLVQAVRRYVRLIDEHLYRLYPQLLQAWKEEQARLDEQVVKVARKFSQQYTRLVDDSADYRTDAFLQERIRRGADWFARQLAPLEQMLAREAPATDNKEIKKKLQESLEELQQAFRLKNNLLGHVVASGFSTADYLKQKALLSIDDTSSAKVAKHSSSAASTGRARSRSNREAIPEVPSDILYPDLYRRLTAWRNAEAARLGLPVYTVIQQKAILGISNLLPDTLSSLGMIPYFGKKGVEKYGEELLEMVREYKERRGKEGGI